jgi:hypothetical protein
MNLRNLITKAGTKFKERRVKEMLEWIDSNPNRINIYKELDIKRSSFSLKEEGDSNIGIFAEKSIKKGEEIANVSAQNSLTSFELQGMDKSDQITFKKKLAERMIRIASEKHKNFDVLMNTTQLVSQLFVGRADKTMFHSPLSEYCAAAPLFTLPIYLRPNHLELLSHTSLNRKTHGYLSTIDRIHGDLVADLYPGLDKAAFVRLFGFCRSRLLNLWPQEAEMKVEPLIICPFVDLFNHASNRNCAAEGVYDRVLDDSIVSVKAVRDIEAGEELTISYGTWGTAL